MALQLKNKNGKPIDLVPIRQCGDQTHLTLLSKLLRQAEVHRFYKLSQEERRRCSYKRKAAGPHSVSFKMYHFGRKWKDPSAPTGIRVSYATRRVVQEGSNQTAVVAVLFQVKLSAEQFSYLGYYGTVIDFARSVGFEIAD